MCASACAGGCVLSESFKEVTGKMQNISVASVNFLSSLYIFLQAGQNQSTGENMSLCSFYFILFKLLFC